MGDEFDEYESNYVRELQLGLGVKVMVRLGLRLRITQVVIRRIVWRIYNSP